MRATWVTQGRLGVRGDAEDVHDAALDLDYEQHVVAPEQESVDVEEVRGHDVPCMGPEELRPGRTLAYRNRS
jgi:hypothetical protein